MSQILNSQIMKNAQGETITVKENLENITDYGKAVSALNKNDLLDFYGNFVAGVIRYEFGLREYKPTSLGIIKKEEDFMGVLERIKNRSLLEATSSPVGKLQDGQSYIDGKYHGADFDNKAYTKWDSYRLIHSMEDTDSQIKQRFSSIEGVMGFAALIASRFKNSIRAQRHEIEKRVLLGGVVNAFKDGREIKLLTMYNTEKGSSLTAANCMTSADFQRFALNTIADVRAQITEGINQIYNDGTCVTFTNPEDVRTVMLAQFASACRFNLLATTFNDEYLKIGQYTELPFWQNRGSEMAPRVGQSGNTIAQVHATDGATQSPEEYEVENLIAVIYDEDALSSRIKTLEPVVEPVYGGRFNNYIHDEEFENLVDPRSSLVIFTLN